MTDQDKEKTPYYLSDLIKVQFNPIFYGGQFWYEKNGVLKPAEIPIRNFLLEELKDKFSSHKVKETLYALEAMCFVERINLLSEFISLENGIYDWTDDQLFDHEPSVKFLNQIPVQLNKEAQCPMITKFLNEVVKPEDKKALLQFIGYCLIPDTRYEKALLLVGEGANGKSTLLKLLISLIGRDNITTLSLYDLSHRFRLAELVGKLANIFPDLPYKRLEDSSNFKAIVSGDPIMGERKYGKPFTFFPYAKLIFSANRMPSTKDISEAFFRRWLIIEFPNSFKGKERDTNLLNKLTTQEELEGFVLLAIEGLKSLSQEGDFAESDGMKALKTEYEQMNNPVAAFIDERCLIDPNVSVGKTELYRSFRDFAYEGKMETLGRNEFQRELIKQVPSVQEVRNPSRKWRGIALLIPCD